MSKKLKFQQQKFGPKYFNRFFNKSFQKINFNKTFNGPQSFNRFVDSFNKTATVYGAVMSFNEAESRVE